MAIAVGNLSAQAALPGMGEAEFERWVGLLEKRTGVVVPATRKSFLITGLRGRMRETGHKSFEQYYNDLLDGPRGAIEWTTLVDRLTVHETHFFRHQPSLDLIGNEWLPEAIGEGVGGALHAWSLGCSTGEEAYTLAMVLDSALARLAASKVYFGITATDVSQPALAVGRAGLYAREKLVEIPESLRDTYCEAVGDDSFAIREHLRKRVGFALFNLLDVARAPLKRLDLIFCQNVLIYFARERRKELLGALASLLKPGGMLVLGPGEVLSFSHPNLVRVSGRQTLAYRRTA